MIAAYVADEMQRINERLRGMIEGAEPPPQELRDDIMQDIETTMKRLQAALSQIPPEDDAMNEVMQ